MKTYTIPKSLYQSLESGLIIRDESPATKQQLIEKFNELYMLFLSKFSALGRTATMYSDEQGMVSLVKELFDIKRKIEKKG
jgi:hypothetical protein